MGRGVWLLLLFIFSIYILNNWYFRTVCELIFLWLKFIYYKHVKMKEKYWIISWDCKLQFLMKEKYIYNNMNDKSKEIEKWLYENFEDLEMDKPFDK